MQKINSSGSLRSAILELEAVQEVQGKILKEELHQAYESIKPINLIKSTFKEVAESPEIKEKLLNTAVGLGAGYVSKKLFEGVSHGPLRKLLGTVLMFGITQAVAKNPEAVKSLGTGVLKMIGKGIHQASLCQIKHHESPS